MNPHRLTWSFAYHMQFAKMAAIATLVGLTLSGGAKPLPRTWPTALLLAFWIWITLTTLLANYPELAWHQWQEVSKILLMTLVTILLFQELPRIRYLVFTIALSIAFFGAKTGLAGLLVGFASSVSAYPPETFIADNNDLALALNLVLPLLVVLANEEQRPLLKGALYAIAGLTVLGVLSTFSRGGFLGLVTTILLLVLRSRRKVLGLTLTVLAGLVAASVLSSDWYNRMGTITEYHDDPAAQNRLEAWTVATKLALDSPVVGGGFRTLQPEVYQRYGYSVGDAERVAHSIFFQVLSDHGFVGLIIFAALIAATLLSLGRVARKTASVPSRSELGRLAQAVQTGLIAFVVSGTFLSRAYFDLFFHLIAIAAVLPKLHGQGVSPEAEETFKAGAVADPPPLRRIG